MAAAGKNRGAGRRGGHHRAGGGGHDTGTIATAEFDSDAPFFYGPFNKPRDLVWHYYTDDDGISHSHWLSGCFVACPFAPPQLSYLDLPGAAAESDAAPSQPAATDSEPGA